MNEPWPSKDLIAQMAATIYAATKNNPEELRFDNVLMPECVSSAMRLCDYVKEQYEDNE